MVLTLEGHGLSWRRFEGIGSEFRVTVTLQTKRFGMSGVCS